MDASQWATPDLQELVDLFYDSPEELGEFEEVEADKLPPNYRQLLAHHSHMTVTLEEFHRSMVDVRVLDSITSNSHYSRTIVLHRKSDSRAVQTASFVFIVLFWRMKFLRKLLNSVNHWVEFKFATMFSGRSSFSPFGMLNWAPR